MLVDKSNHLFIPSTNRHKDESRKVDRKKNGRQIEKNIYCFIITGKINP